MIKKMVMAKKFTLDARPEPAYYTLAGISCHLKDYRLSFLLNQAMGCDFIKMEDLPGGYSLYFYRDEECRNTYSLISNRSAEKILFPGLKQTDFILLVEGPYKKSQLNRLVNNLKTIPNILTAFEIQAQSLKNFAGFLDDLELHFMNIRKKAKLKSVSL
jgi:hypothetical protein